MTSRFQLPTLEPTRTAAPMLSARAEEVERDALRAAAREEGYAEGMEQARAEALASMASAVSAVESMVAELTARRDALCAAVEPAAVSLALVGAEQIVGGVLDVKPELIEHAARGALRRLVERERVIVLVNPSDLDHMRVFASELVDQLGGIDALEVQAERRIAPGGVVIQTPVGDIDARLDTRLAGLGDVVRDALAR